MLVIATEDCFFKNVRRHAGEHFQFTGEADNLPEWVEVVEKEPEQDDQPARKPRRKSVNAPPDDF